MNIETQLQWEQDLANRGSAKYISQQDKLKNSGSGDQTQVGSYLIKTRTQEVADLIEASVSVALGRGAKYNKMLRVLAQDDYLKVAYIGISAAFQGLMTKKKDTLLAITIAIGKRLEADIKCVMFEKMHPEYYNTVMQSFKDQKVTDYQHKHKVMMLKFKEFNDMQWVDLDTVMLGHVGLRVLDCILAVFDDVLEIDRQYNKGRQVNKLKATPEFNEWVREFENVRGCLNPILLPLKIPPMPWDREGNGGYYSTRLASAFPLIKTKNKAHRVAIKGIDPEQHRRAINKLQRTAWCINKDVYDVQREMRAKNLGVGLPSNTAIVIPTFPEYLDQVAKEDLTEADKHVISNWKERAKDAYAREKGRKASVIAFIQTTSIADELYDWDEFYYAYNACFRGRIYPATSGLSPQGHDTARGILQFATGIALGRGGIKWLGIHGANTYGIDKVTYDARYQWTQLQSHNIRRVVEDPIGTRDYWSEADKPWQFLAFCFEWARCDYGNDPTTLSHLPVGLDGSCNGIQHFSAMLADEVGARATNLKEPTSPQEAPQDIYQEVCNATKSRLDTMDDPRARKWLEVGIPRKLCKPPVMTMPYGSTLKACRQTTYAWVEANWHLFKLHDSLMWDHVSFITDVIWAAIGEVVIKAREIMQWLRQNTPAEFMNWLSPVGFPVYQYYQDAAEIRIRTQLCGVTCLYAKDFNGASSVPMRGKQRNGIVPNFVHSLDSSHLVMTVNMTDFNSYSMIHDEFGTHACNVQRLQEMTQLAFMKLYATDVLQAWGDQVGATTEKPTKGEYDIAEIRKATYFFG